MRLAGTPPPLRTEAMATFGCALPTDGAAVLDRIIDELATHQGPRVIVWDIDGTLVDTRPRMLAALHAYGRTDISLEQLRGTALTTTEVVATFGVDPQRFKLVWDRVFWDPAAFRGDITIPATVERMRRAASLGITNIIMTGRNQELAAATAADLRARDIPFDTLMCKRRGEKTVDDKAGRLEGLIVAGTRVGAFVTDSPPELAAINARIGAGKVCGVLVVAQGKHVTATAELRAHVLPVPLTNG